MFFVPYGKSCEDNKNKMNKEVTNKVLTDVREKHKGLSDAILCLTVMDVRHIIEDTVEETKYHIAEKLVESREQLLEFLLDQGFINGEETKEDMKELVYDALYEL